MIRVLALPAALALLAGAVGCSGSEARTLSEEDELVLSQLTSIAAQDAEVEGALGEIECWAPSESVVSSTSFRVICRVHYEQAGDDRYRDMICIGEFARDPAVDYCYPWAYYSDMPEFEDHPAYSVTAATV